MVFIDPKGLIHLDLSDDQKLDLHNHLRNEVQKYIKDPNVKLDAFIVSSTLYVEAQDTKRKRLPIKEYEEKHLLFQKMRKDVPNPGYIDSLFNIALKED